MSSLPSTMRAAQITEYNKPYQVKEVPRPTIRPHELLIRVKAAGFCHSDLQVLEGEFPGKLPITPSHEPAGIVEEVGQEAASTWKIGNRVGVLNFKNACRKCSGCTGSLQRYGNADPRFCQHREMAGFFHDGAFGEYMVADSATTVALPDSVSFEQGAPLLCAGATVWGALEKAEPFIQAGDSVGIVGIGGLGQLGLQFAKALGYKTVAISDNEQGLQLAASLSQAMQPDLSINNSDPEKALNEIMKFTNGEGLAAVVNCTDSLDGTAWSLRLLQVGGCLVPLGLPPSHWSFDPQLIVFRELVIRGNYVCGRESTEKMMKLVVQYNIQSQLTVVDFDQIVEIPELFKSRAFTGRLVVKF